MKAKIIKTIQKIFEKFGIYVASLNQRPDFMARVSRLLTKRKISIILDIGANDGAFAEKLLLNGFTGKIISVEPTKKAYEKLQKRASKIPNWIVEKRCAIGGSEKNVKINISRNSVSSSLLRPKKDIDKVWKGMKIVKREKVKMLKLDHFIKKYKRDFNKLFLKLDTQGYEMNILKNCKNIDKINGIILELQIKQYYQTRYNFRDIINFLSKKGFKMIDLEPGFRDKNGSVIEFDALYVK